MAQHVRINREGQFGRFPSVPRCLTQYTLCGHLGISLDSPSLLGLPRLSLLRLAAGIFNPPEWIDRFGRKMPTPLLQLCCDFLPLPKPCPTYLKAEPQYPPASSRLNGNRPWPRSIIEHLEEAIS